MDKDLDANPTPKSKGEEDLDVDIFKDLPDFRYDETLDQLQASVAKLEAENHVLQSRLVQVSEEKKSLGINYSALFKTAKLEIKRKERTIAELRDKLNKVRPHREQFGLKRRRETTSTPSPRKRRREPTATPSPRKRAKLSSEKVRKEIRPPREEDVRRRSKPKVEASERDERSPTYVEKVRRNEKEFENENARMKDPLDKKKPLVNGNIAAPCENMVDPSFTKAAPSLPALHCPTLFSGRMYKRIYGSYPKDTLTTLSGSTETIQPAVVDEQPKSSKLPQRGQLTHCNVNPPDHRSSSPYVHRRVTPEYIRAYLEVECPSESDSSSSSSAQSSPTRVKPFASSYVKSQNRSDETSSKVTQAELKPEPHKQVEPPIIQLEVHGHQPPAVEPLSVPPTPSDETKCISSRVNAGTSALVALADLKPEPRKYDEPPHKKLQVPIHQPSAVEPLSVPPTASDETKDLSSTVNAGNSSLVARADLIPEPRKHDEPPHKKLQVPIHQPSAVEPLSVPPTPSDETKDLSSKVNAGTSSLVARADLIPEPRKHDEPPHKKLQVPIHQPSAVEPLSAPPTPSDESKDISSKENAGTSSLVARTHLKPEPHKHVHQPIHQPPAVEPLSIPLLPTDETKDISSKMNANRSITKSPIANVNLSAVGKVRHQTVAAIRPIQQLAAQETPALVDKSDKISLTTRFPASSIENLPESKPSEINSGGAVRSAEKPNRHLKIPGLPGSAKGRTVRRVFAPISNQWNYSLPTASNQNGSGGKGYGELSVVQTVSVTSELTVRVEDSKLDELRRQSLAETVFGSPVKWADDSLDSPITEANSQKTIFYSIFGSPHKSVDSNSSEHPFSVPPGAYEDSCLTNQIPEKLQKPSTGEPDLQKQSQRSQEPASVAETKPIEKSRELNEAEKVTTASSICPPSSLSVIKKNVSIFSPEEDSRLTMPSNIADDPSRSNTGIFFQFPKPVYEDSVLGQFDDTAQFVSAVASNFRVNSEISPLSTPIKSGEGSNHIQSVIVKNNPTSFEEVVSKNFPENPQQNHEPSDGTVGIVANIPNLSLLPKCLSDEKDTAETHNKSLLSRHSPSETHAPENVNIPDCRAEDPQSQRTVELPTVTITSPDSKTSHYDGSLRIVHRPNLASSTMNYSVKSWFPKDTPVHRVNPRKTPRLFTRVSGSASSKPNLSINDAFIFEQEERVRRRELDHLHDNTIMSASGSSMKSVNGSPTRKRIELSGKNSPSKRSPKKQVSSCKSPRRPELCRNILCPSGADTLVSRVASHMETTGHQVVPGSTNQLDLVACLENVVSNQTTAVPKSLPDTTPKLLNMLSTLLINAEHAKPRAESSSVDTKNCETVDRSFDLPTERAKSQVEDEASVVDLTKSTDRARSKPTSESTLKRDIVPSLPLLDLTRSCCNDIHRQNSVPPTLSYSDPLSRFPGEAPLNKVTLRRDASSQLAKSGPVPIGPALSPNKDIADAPLNMVTPRKAASSHIAESGRVRIGPSLRSSKCIAETSHMGSADPAVPPSGSSNVTNAKLFQITLSGQAKPSTEGTSNKKEKQNKAKSTGSATSKCNDSSECLVNTPPGDDAKLNGGPIEKSVVRSSKYASIITRVKPSTPLNKSVAALITSSIKSAPSLSSRPHPTITTPIAQSTKKINFKRSSALKANTQKGSGNSLMNSIRSTFYQGTPTSSAKAGNSGEQLQTPKPRLSHRKSLTMLGVKSTNEVMTVQSTTHSHVVTRSQKNVVKPTAEGAVRDGVPPSRERTKTVLQGSLRGTKDTSTRKDVAPLSKTLEPVGYRVTPSSEPAKSVEMESNFPGQWKLLEVDRSTKPIPLSQRLKTLKENDTLHNPLDFEVKETSNVPTENSKSRVEKDTSTLLEGVESRTELEPIQISTIVLNGDVERICKEKPEKQVLPNVDGAKELNQHNAKPPPKRSSPRKTILLDAPMKMETPTKKQKRSGDAVKSPKPKEKPVNTTSGETSRTRTPGECQVSFEKPSPDKSNKTEPESPHASQGVCCEKTSPEKSSKKHSEPERCHVNVQKTSPKNYDKRFAEPERPHFDRRVNSERTWRNYSSKRRYEPERRHVELPRASLRMGLRDRHFRRSRSVSVQVSSRRLHATRRDVSPEPRERKKSRTTHYHSPERSPARKPKHHEKRHHKHETCKISASESLDNRSKVTCSDSVDEKSKLNSSKPSQRRSRIVSPVSSGKQSKNSSSGSADRQSKTISSDSETHERFPARKSKSMKLNENHQKDEAPISSSKSSDRRSKVTSSESVGEKSKNDSLETSGRRSRIGSPEYSGKQSNNSSSESTDRRSKISSNCTNKSSYESDKITSESVDENSVKVEVLAVVPQPKASPWPRSKHKKLKLIGARLQNCETPRVPEFKTSVGITTSTSRIQPNPTPTNSTSSILSRLLGERPIQFNND